MSHGMESFVAICKAANPEFSSFTLEHFEENYGCFEISFTCEVFGILGLTTKVGTWWELTPHVHELLVEEAALNSEDSALTRSEYNSIDDDPYLLRTIFIAAGWEEDNETDFFEFACNVLKVLGLVVGGPGDHSWKPTARLKSLLMSRLVRSLKPDVRVTKTDSPEVDDQDLPPNDTWNGDDEDYENPSGEDNNRPESIFKRRSQMVVGTRPKGTGSISRLSVAKRGLSSA